MPADLTVGQFVYVIRKRIKLSAEKAIFIFIDNVLPPTGVFPLLISGFWKVAISNLDFGEQFSLLLWSELTALSFAGAIMSAIYDEKKDEDGFLYVTYSGENTFGGVNEL